MIAGAKKGKGDRRAAIVDAVAEIVGESGVAGVAAREVAKRAGVALGALYLDFGTLDAAVVAANARTLEALDAEMATVVAGLPSADSAEVFQALGLCYVTFAMSNRAAWAALFEFSPRDRGVLDSHHEALERLVDRIAIPLQALRPDLPPGDARIRARTLFGAVHGVVHMALEGRQLGAPRALLEREVAALIDAMARGFVAARSE